MWRLHVYVPSCTPLGSGDASQSGRGKVQAGFAARKRADDLCASTDFLHQAFQRIFGAQLDPLAIVLGPCMDGSRWARAFRLKMA
jgi:hypothetical protein